MPFQPVTPRRKPMKREYPIRFARPRHSLATCSRASLQPPTARWTGGGNADAFRTNPAVFAPRFWKRSSRRTCQLYGCPRTSAAARTPPSARSTCGNGRLTAETRYMALPSAGVGEVTISQEPKTPLARRPFQASAADTTRGSTSVRARCPSNSACRQRFDLRPGAATAPAFS